MQKFKLSLVALPVIAALTACGSDNDPNKDDIPVVIEQTHAEVTLTATKGTLSGADISVTMINGSSLNPMAATLTDATGEGTIALETNLAFGIDGIVKVAATASEESAMICDALICGSAVQAGEITGEEISGAELSTLAFLSVPYGNPTDSDVDLTVQANALTTLATRLIEQAILDGRNVSSQQLLEIAQSEYSTIVTRALGLDTKANIFTTNVVSAESADNFILGEECEQVPVVDEDGNAVTDEDGNAVTEEQCSDVIASEEEAQLSFLNASLSYFNLEQPDVAAEEEEGEEPAPVVLPVTQQEALDAAYNNLVLAIDGDTVALEALRAPVVATLTDNDVLTAVNLTIDDMFDSQLPVFEVALSSGPVHEITTADNVASATITARNQIGDGESADKAFDGDLTTKWLDHNDWAGAPSVEDPSWIQMDFAEAQAVNTIVLTSGGDAPERDPENFDLLGSNDGGVTWITIASFVGESFDERVETKSFKFSNGLKYTSYRLNITKNKGDNTLMQITEIDFVGPIYTSVDHSDMDGIVVTARNRIGDGEAESMAFDNDPTTKWLDHNDWAGAPSVEDPSWIQVDFPEAVAVDTLALTSGGDAPERDPENFDVLGSNDGGATWTTVAAFVGESFDDRVERKSFAVDNQLAFSTYRLSISKNKGDDSLMQITEIELIGPELAGLNHGMQDGIVITERFAISDAESGKFAFDGSSETKWLDHNEWAGAPTTDDPAWVKAVLETPAAVNTIAMISGGDAPERDPENFDLLGSNDGETWIKLASFVGESFDDRAERKQFSFTNGLTFSQYQVNITKNKGDDTLMQVAEIELIGPQYELVNHGMSEGVTIDSSGYIGDGEHHDKAFDGNPESKWLDPNDWAGAPSEEEPFWVQVDLTSEQIVTTLALTSGGDASSRDPENFNLQGSNDGGTTWTTVNSWIGETFDARTERKVFDFGNGFAYSSYRFNITKNQGDDTLMQVAEIELIGPQK